MKNIAVFGGAFDPPHKGHQKVVNYLLDELGMDYVEVVPSGMHRNKQIEGSSYYDRCEMVGKLFLNDNRVRVSKADSPSYSNEPGAGSSLTLMNRIGSQWDYAASLIEDLIGYNLYCVIGQDNADNIRSFYRWGDLLDRYTFIVLPRGENREDPKNRNAWYTQKPHKFLDKFTPIDVSSTEIRENIEHDLLPKEVYDYIKVKKYTALIK